MDMWKPFMGAMTLLLPDASTKIVFDRFHIVSHMNHAVDMVRRRENRSLRAEGDERLVGGKSLWLYGIENVPRDRWRTSLRCEARTSKPNVRGPARKRFAPYGRCRRGRRARPCASAGTSGQPTRDCNRSGILSP
jgi:transposase